MTTLGSPGTQVSVVNESFYTPAAPGTVPLIFVATAQDKNNASATGTAQGTIQSNVGTVWATPSQRDLTDTFGTPIFYTDTSGNPKHGDELNEYGLQAAYSTLGVNSRAYVVRADVDLAALTPSTSVPTGMPVAGTYWVDTANSIFGINEWNSSGRGSFTVKTPLIIDNDNTSTAATLSSDIYTPADGFGSAGDYAMVITSNNTNALWYKTTATSSAWVAVHDQFDGTKSVQVSPHTDYPNFTTSTDTGSVWVKTTTPGQGANWTVKYYNAAAQLWNNLTVPLYGSTQEAIQKLDYNGGGKNIPVNSTFIQYNYNNDASTKANFEIWRRNSAGTTTVVSNESTLTTSSSVTINMRATGSKLTNWSNTVTVTINGSTSNSVASLFPAALSAAGLANVSASYNATSKKITLTHSQGGDVELKQTSTTTNFLADLFDAYDSLAQTGTRNLYDAPSGDNFTFLASNWKPLSYVATASEPSTTPEDGSIWYDSNLEVVDIMYHNGTTWVGYLDADAFVDADPAGPIISALEPMNGDRSDNGDLVEGDIWVSTADTDKYGNNIYVYDGSNWILQDTTDQTSPDGWVFADARWGTAGSDIDPASIEELLISNYLDPDAPDPALYPKGTCLWNTRRSGAMVKKYVSGYINVKANDGMNLRYEDEDMSMYNVDRWVSQHPVNEDGSGKFGRYSQRGYVVAKLKSLIDTNSAVRDTDTLVYNLIACPGYPEVIANMVALNVDRGLTAFVVGDTPFRLAPTATALSNWGNNTALAYDNGDQGAVTYDESMGMFYPSGYTTDNTGNNIVVPPSHMMIRTIINSDAKSYQWFAPSGTRRGGVDNASSVGYITSEGEFQPVSLYEGLRSVLHDVKINPIATMPGAGIVNMGQYTRAKDASALDRINVSRLVSFLRYQLDILSKPFLFEPNDAQTRNEIKSAVESLLLELVGQRALYDFIVVCDKTNNTPTRIDRSELYVDIAIEPVKAVEFIYIPLRILSTGAIAAGNLGSVAK